jgi:hypothetical protein
MAVANVLGQREPVASKNIDTMTRQRGIGATRATSSGRTSYPWTRGTRYWSGGLTVSVVPRSTW